MKNTLRFAVFPLLLLMALVPTPAQADGVRAVDLTSITVRVGEQPYTKETLRGLVEVAQSAPVNIEARVKSTVVTSAAIEVVAELDPTTLRWQVEDVMTGERTAWKYSLTRLRLPPPPFDVQITVQGKVRAVEEPQGVFKPYLARLFHIDVGGVVEVDYHAKAVHPTAIVLARDLESTQVPAGPPALSSYIAALKLQIAESLEAGKVGHAESLMGVLKDLTPVVKAAAAATEGDRALVTTLTITAVILAAIAVGGWALWLLGRQRATRGGKANAHVNDRLESLWR